MRPAPTLIVALLLGAACDRSDPDDAASDIERHVFTMGELRVRAPGPSAAAA